jgi:hypothetical protein
MAKKPKVEIEDVPTEADIARGDAVLKRMLQTKPKPHKEMVGKSTKKTKTRSTKGAG